MSKTKKSKGNFLFLKIILVLILIGLIIVGAVIGYGYCDINGIGKSEQDITLEVEQGTPPSVVASLLKENKLINSEILFKQWLARTGMDKTMQYGTFNLQVGMSYEEIATEMQTHFKDVETVRITFPEGENIQQFAKKIEEAGLCTFDDFIDTANSADFSQYEWWNAIDMNEHRFMRAEGYLFPNTYEFYPDDTAYDIVAKLFAEFDKQFTPELRDAAAEKGFTVDEIVILASLIQDEAGDPVNMPPVSAVFNNRINDNSLYPKLESDVTFFYLRDFVNPYLESHGMAKLEYDDPMWEAYYTYDCIGLPAGPMSNPGINAIKAAIYPEENSPYYFFVTDEAGKYYYAATDVEHEKNKAEVAKVNASLK